MTPRARYHLEQLAYKSVRQGLETSSLQPLVRAGLITPEASAAALKAAEHRAKFDDRLDRILRGEVSGVARLTRLHGHRLPRSRRG